MGDKMKHKQDKPMSEQNKWWIIGIVFLSLVIVLGIVYKREKEKPDSPHALVAAGFAQMFSAQEWKPGMGKKPLVYHPAASNTPVWRPLPGRSAPKNFAPAAGG